MKDLHDIIKEYDCSLTNNQLLDCSLALLYQEKSKYDKFSFLQERYRISLFQNPLVVEKAIKPYKIYPSKKAIPLCLKKMESKHPLFRIIEERRSKRNFKKYNISLNELYQILHYSYGITGKANVIGGTGIWHYRAVPSGGALYPLEIYIYVNHSIIPEGLYHYRPDNDTIEQIDVENRLNEFIRYIAVGNIDINNCACLIFITSICQRHMIKYGERGFRFILQEVGAVSQNISLICQSINLSSCIIGGYMDDEINRLIGVSSPMETIQGIIAIGKV